MRRAFPPTGSVPGITMRGPSAPMGYVSRAPRTWHPFLRGLCPGVRRTGHPLPRGPCLGVPRMLTGWDALALLHCPLSSQQQLGEHFSKLGTGTAVPRSHARSKACGSGRGEMGGMGSSAAAEGLWPCPFSASSAGYGGMSRTR